MYKRMGYEKLSETELLQIVIRETKGNGLADKLLHQFGTLQEAMLVAEESELMEVEGIGAAKAVQLKAVGELFKRMSKPIANRRKINCPADAANILMPDMRFLKKEVFVAMLLDTKNNVISVETISVGILGSSQIHCRETFNAAIRKSAARLVVAHNHPSGDPTPSRDDIAVTEKLKKAGEIIGIELMDHIVIGDSRFISLKEMDLI